MCLDAIDRQAAIDDLKCKDPSQIWDTADVEVWVNALPSAQPEIVQCKDCKHWERNDGYCYEIKICGCDKDFYCGYAERKPMVEYIVKETATQKEVIGKLIRCKDCGHWSRESICDGFCSEDCMRHDEEFYCGYAEKRMTNVYE